MTVVFIGQRSSDSKLTGSKMHQAIRTILIVRHLWGERKTQSNTKDCDWLKPAYEVKTSLQHTFGKELNSTEEERLHIYLKLSLSSTLRRTPSSSEDERSKIDNTSSPPQIKIDCHFTKLKYVIKAVCRKNEIIITFKALPRNK